MAGQETHDHFRSYRTGSMVDGAGCKGYRCVDRDECHVYNELTKSTALAHDSSCCGSVVADEHCSFQYQNKAGELQFLRFVARMNRWLISACVSAVGDGYLVLRAAT